LSNNNDVVEKDKTGTKHKSGIITKWLWPTLMSLASAFLALKVEYKSGFFQNASASHIAMDTFSAFLLAMTVMLMFESMIIAIFDEKYFRENYSLMAFMAFMFSLVMLITTLVSSSMPWAVYSRAITFIVNGKIANLSDPSFSDYGFMLCVIFIEFIIFGRIFYTWRGLKSENQYRNEQQNNSITFIEEGYSELRRILKRKPGPQLHIDSDNDSIGPLLSGVADSLAWKDQSKELIKLSSSSYVFEHEGCWHDRTSCWIGYDINTSGLVAIHPCQNDISLTKTEEIIAYVNSIAVKDNANVSEIIIAIKEPTEDATRINEPFLKHVSEKELLDRLVNFNDYFNDIKKRVIVDKLSDSDLRLVDIYVPSQCVSIDNQESRMSIEGVLNDWLNESSSRQLALMGEYGQGKSTAVLMWAYSLIKNGIDPNQRIPILIELRGTSPRNLTPLQLLGAWSSQYNINPQALMRLLIAGRLVLIFEGFDEMALVGDLEMRIKHFRTLWQFAYPGAKILITGRPNFFLDEKEMKSALGISKPIGNQPYCEALRLLPFSIGQIKRALRSYKPEVIKQIHSLAKRNTRFMELAGRPSLLYIIGVLWEREKLFEKIDQLTSAYVIDLFIRHSYTRQGLKEKDTQGFMALTTLEREYFMAGIATYMATMHLPNQITGVQLNEIIMNLIGAIPESVSVNSPATLGETSRPLQRRIEGSKHAIESIKTDVRACGILVDDPIAPGSFRFGHKSFMEYLFADVIAERIRDDGSEKARAIFKATNAEIQDILELPAAVYFLTELLAGLNKNGETESLMAKRLLKTLMGENSLGCVIARIAAQSELTINNFSKRFSLKSRSLSAIVLIVIPGILMFGIISLPEMGRYFLHKGKPSDFQQALTLTLAYSVAFTYYYYFLKPRHATIRKIRLWYLICKKVEIEDSIIHEVLGTNLIPWLRNKSFDFGRLLKSD
jgi:hypothetical protein